MLLNTEKTRTMAKSINTVIFVKLCECTYTMIYQNIHILSKKNNIVAIFIYPPLNRTDYKSFHKIFSFFSLASMWASDCSLGTHTHPDFCKAADNVCKKKK